MRNAPSPPQMAAKTPLAAVACSPSARSQLSLPAALTLAALLLAGCDLLSSIAPPPAATSALTSTPLPAPTATVTPTPGPREYINAVYCWPSTIEQGEFNLLRFFGDGTIIDVFVAHFATCEDAWQQVGSYLTLENVMTYNHGEYYLSGDLIRFELAKAGTTEMVGEVMGRLERDKMFLDKSGATLEFTRINIGN